MRSVLSSRRNPFDHTRSRVPFAANSAPAASPLYAIRRVGQIGATQTATSEIDVLQPQASQADQALASLTDAAHKHDLGRYRVTLVILVEDARAA